MGRPKQNLPRTLREPPRAHARSRDTPAKQGGRSTRGRVTAAFAAIAILTAIALLAHTNTRAATENRIEHEVSTLLAGVPQHGSTLGAPNAPITLQVFLDLKDPDSSNWFLTKLPAIIHQQVRPGTLKLEYHAYKTNTYSPQEFVKDQTAALAAGAQDKLWNYIYTFFHEQGSEFAPYATETYLENIAHQISGLSLTQWHTDRHTGRREERTTAEDQTARTLGLHVTPSFRIGRSGRPLHNYAGHTILKYGEQHPIALPEASDINKAIHELERP